MCPERLAKREQAIHLRGPCSPSLLAAPASILLEPVLSEGGEVVPELLLSELTRSPPELETGVGLRADAAAAAACTVCM